MKLSKLAIGLCALGVVASGPASADLLAHANMTNQQIIVDPNPHVLPLRNSGAKTVWFRTTVPNQRIGILYNAECTVDGTDNVSWLDVDIKVDGVTIAPSNGDNAFCTDHGTNQLWNWVSGSTNGGYRVPNVGWHRVQVVGQLKNFNAGDRWRMDDSSLLIMK